MKTFGPGVTDITTAACPAGKTVLGGGYGWVGLDQNVVINVSAHTGGHDGWFAQGQNPSAAGSARVYAYAICAQVSS